MRLSKKLKIPTINGHCSENFNEKNCREKKKSNCFFNYFFFQSFFELLRDILPTDLPAVKNNPQF